METTLESLKEELKPYKDTLVINHFDKVVRLVDVIDEIEDDFYWVYDSRTGIEYESCVVGWVPLKGYIRDKDYEKLVRIWNLNNIEKAI